LGLTKYYKLKSSLSHEEIKKRFEELFETERERRAYYLILRNYYIGQIQNDIITIKILRGYWPQLTAKVSLSKVNENSLANVKVRISYLNLLIYSIIFLPLTLALMVLGFNPEKESTEKVVGLVIYLGVVTALILSAKYLYREMSKTIKKVLKP